MAITLPDAQRKRKRSAALLPAAAQRKAAEELDNNIIEFEILPRLPAKSVCRFKSVSKHWKAFLSTRIFGKMHRQLQTNKSYKILLIDKPPVDLCREPLNHGSVTVGFNRLEEADPRFDSLLASLDGLVCVASTKTIISLALWNPFTGAYYKLPSHPSFTRPFNTAKKISHSGRDVVGFYSDDSSDDYKLLYLVYGDGAYIYSQRLNSWRKIEFLIIGGGNYYDPYPFLHLYSWSQATFCDHSLYFSVMTTELHHQYIICFDVNTEEFMVIQFPPLPSDAWCSRHANLVVIDGCIHLSAAYRIGNDIEWFQQGSLWKLNGDGATWAEVAVFPGEPGLYVFPKRHPRRTCMTRNARDSWLAISEGGRHKSTPFQVMNMEEFTLTDHVLPLRSYCRIIYDETLVSPYPLPPYGDMAGHSNDVKATVVACKL